MASIANTRRTVIAVIVVAVLVAALVGGRALWHRVQTAISGDQCTMGSYQVSTDQASVAATMVGAVTSHSPALPERAAVLALAAGLQESKLTDLAPGDGDRDSVGVLQQRPSQGWGNPPGNTASLTDVFEATREFLDALVKIPHWSTLPLATAVQAVQVSADGSQYAKHEGEAQALADALSGQKPAGITCSFSAPTKVAATATVAKLVRADLPIAKPSTTRLTVRVPGAHWQTAAWFVANGDRLGVEQVAYDGHTWVRSHGWHDSTAGSGAVVATMYH